MLLREMGSKLEGIFKIRTDVVLDLLVFTPSFDPHYNLRQGNVYSLIFREETMAQPRYGGIHL